MKVLLITVRSDFGGGPKHVNQLISGLPSDVELYMAYPADGDPYSDMWQHNERIKETVNIPFRNFSFPKLFELKRFVELHEIDIVHSHGNGAGVYSRLLKLIGCKAKIIHTFHGITESYDSFGKSIANRIMGRYLRHFTDKFILVSKSEYAIAQRHHFINRCGGLIVYNGIEEPCHNEYRTGTVLNIITLSRFDYQKNMDFAYEIARYYKHDSRLRFIWLGDGEDKSRLEAKSKAEGCNIDFLGFVREPMMYIANASIYLSTSRFEGLPYGIIEASSMGIPTIATDVRGNNEVVQDSVTGYLFKTKEEAISIINKFLEHPDILPVLSKNSRDYFLNTFTIDRMISVIYIIYKSVIKKELKRC